MRVITIFARHGTEKYQDAEARLHSLFEKQLPSVERKTVIVDNALPDDFEEEQSAARLLIGGDNEAWEFSAWDKGLRRIGDEIWRYDFVHLATSAFHTLYTKYLERFDEALLKAAAGRPACIGHIDCYNEAVRIRSFQSQSWMRTSFLFIPPVELKMLGNVVSVAREDSVFGPNPEEPFREEQFISRNYQNYVLDWLTGSEIGQGTSWHSKINLDDRSWPFFKAKAMAIFNEHLLAIRMRAQATNLIDATWLATKLREGSSAAIDWNRGWRKQLAERDSDPLLVPDPVVNRNPS